MPEISYTLPYDNLHTLELDTDGTTHPDFTAYPNIKMGSTGGTGPLTYSIWGSNWSTGAASVDPFASDGNAELVTSTWGRDQRATCRIVPIAYSGTLTAASRTGFAIGTPIAVSGVMASSPTAPCIALYWRGDTVTWELYVGKGTGAAAIVVPLVGAPTPTLDSSVACRIAYYPTNRPRPRVEVSIGGYYFIYAVAANLPLSTAISACGLALFTFSGPNATTANAAGFFAPTHTIVV